MDKEDSKRYALEHGFVDAYFNDSKHVCSDEVLIRVSGNGHQSMVVGMPLEHAAKLRDQLSALLASEQKTK